MHLSVIDCFSSSIMIWEHTLYGFSMRIWKMCAYTHLYLYYGATVSIEDSQSSITSQSYILIFIMQTRGYNCCVHFKNSKICVCSIDTYFMSNLLYALRYLLYFFSWKSQRLLEFNLSSNYWKQTYSFYFDEYYFHYLPSCPTQKYVIHP